MIFNKWCSLKHNYCLMYMFILVISLFFPVYSMAYKTFNALLQLTIFRWLQYSERHTMINHYDRYITHLQQSMWNWYIFYSVRPMYLLSCASITPFPSRLVFENWSIYDRGSIWSINQVGTIGLNTSSTTYMKFSPVSYTHRSDREHDG